MKNISENASISIKELELPEGAILTINDITLNSKVLSGIKMLGNSMGDYNNIKSCLAKNTMLICANADDDNEIIVERDFFSHIKIFYEIIEALQYALREGAGEV